MTNVSQVEAAPAQPHISLVFNVLQQRRTFRSQGFLRPLAVCFPLTSCMVALPSSLAAQGSLVVQCYFGAMGQEIDVTSG